jgi:hypothetical protein
MTTRENRQLDLEGMNETELKELVESLFGEGIYIRPENTVKAILDKEFNTPPKPIIYAQCPRCNDKRGFRSTPVLRDSEGTLVQQIECIACKTYISIPTGENGELFQENFDTPDNTDFSDLE